MALALPAVVATAKDKDRDRHERREWRNERAWNDRSSRGWERDREARERAYRDQLRRDRAYREQLAREQAYRDRYYGNRGYGNYGYSGYSGLDRNRDGVIERREWHDRNGNNRNFNRYDLNRDGVLSPYELRAAGVRVW
jgi:hypothetical protein